MRRVAVLLAAAAAAALAAGGAGAATLDPQVSSNWSGYAAVSPDATTTPLRFSDVTGTWVQPKATCTLGRTSSAAFWVGIGGYDESSPSLEQLGTGEDSNGNSRTPTSYAWWELVPAASKQIKLAVKPGDTVTAAVLVQGQTITFSLRDVTRGTRFSKVLTTPQALDTGSAEWIAEAPSECSSFGSCNVVPLTNFGKVTFKNAAAIADDHPGTIVDGSWDTAPIELVAGGTSNGFFGAADATSGIGAVPGGVTADGRGFSVSWAKNLTPFG